MITQLEADYLLDLEKHISVDDQAMDDFLLSLSIPVKARILLISKEDHDVSFLVEITQSNKNRIKMTLHCQEDGSKIGLLRVDFNSRHWNPETVNDHVPQVFTQYAGQWIEGSHIHYFVEGYKPLAWAIPLGSDDSFPLKEFVEGVDEGNAIRLFAQRIKVKTIIHTEIQTTMEL
jgi:hypothetical protein